ncbi:hypothetical protein Ddye_019779 [Dipteronia dyeriana]|uniref:Transposase MuDR plant domain-containing protein n=1 Tax=Dipteronia dyeriana TaxID=168575 RepID=A0AAD9TZH4_9ROSI|nr:hypothetical protein Ddye_019779 [Dipteronia dyeriana]
MDNIFNITVLHGTNVIDLGQCDADHISLITLVNALSEQLTGSSNILAEEYSVWVQLPWCSDIVEVFTDMDLIDVFKEFGVCGFDTIYFRVEQTCYKPLPSTQGSPNSPIEEPEVVEQIGWCDDEASKFDYVAASDGESGDNGDGECLGADNGDGEGLDGEGLGGNDRDGECLGADNEDGEGLDGDNEDDEGLSGDNGDSVFVSQFENVVGNDDITKQCMNLFEGYESRLDDEFSFDSDTNKSQVKVDKLLRGVSFEREGNEIKFSVGQTFTTKEVMIDIFREYAVHEGVVLDRIKNDKQRQTYQCNAAGCPWRAHTSWIVDKTTLMIKILVDQHECHRVCNNKEVKVKWITSKLESIVKSNPSINVKVLADLLFDKFNVSVDLKRLYNKGLIKALAKHFLTASKRFCARHIYANFRGSYCGASFKKLFWRASRSTNIYEFNVALKDIGEIKFGANE